MSEKDGESEVIGGVTGMSPPSSTFALGVSIVCMRTRLWGWQEVWKVMRLLLNC